MRERTIQNTVVTFGVILFAFPMTVSAQSNVEVQVGTDFVSGYIWRGQNLGGASIQPSISLNYKGFSFEAWGSIGLSKDDGKELDLTIGYHVGGFRISVTDYWGSGEEGYFHYGAHGTAHTFEGQIGYDFGMLAINWYTNFAGITGYNSNDNRAYASYVSLSVPFRIGGVDWSAEIGATPWGNDFYTGGNSYEKDMINGFAVCDVSLCASKEIRITQSFSLPLSAKVTWNPATEGAFFTAGVSF